jgi:hypothetical protein
VSPKNATPKGKRAGAPEKKQKVDHEEERTEVSPSCLDNPARLPTLFYRDNGNVVVSQITLVVFYIISP